MIVPDLGAFIMRERSAYYDMEQKLLFPPFRVVSFNSELTHDDGLLVGSVARREGIAYETASVIVSDEVRAIKLQLRSVGEVSLGSVGRLVSQRKASPVFEPSPKWKLLGANYYEPVEAKSVLEQAHDEAIVARMTDIRRRGRVRRRFITAGKIAASLAVVAMVVSALFFSPIFKSRNDSAASLTYPVMSSTQTISGVGVEASPTLNIMSPQEEMTAAEGNDNFEAQCVSETRQSHAAQEEAEEGLRFSDSDPYCLIVASLPTEELAKQFIAETSGNELKILSKDGKYRVYVATGRNTAEALAMKSRPEIASRFSDAWVCHR